MNEAAKRSICKIAKSVQKCQSLQPAKQGLEAAKRHIYKIVESVQKCQALQSEKQGLEAK